MPLLPWVWPRAEGLPQSAAYIATKDGYISTSDIEDEEEKENDGGEEEILGGEDTTTYRSTIV
jgi:hypothetical protein